MNNNQNIKVSEALKKGQKRLVIPSVALMLFFFLIAPAILMYVFKDDKNSAIFAVGGVTSILFGIISPFIWWGINVVKYKIWAANNVKDIHRFYEEAQIKNLIDERKFFKRLELKTTKQKKELQRFYNRLKAEKVLIRDVNHDIERETIFKSSLKWNIVLFIMLICGMGFLYQTGRYNLKGTLIITGILIILIGYDLYKIFRYKYILKINSEIISYKDNKTLIYWKDVINYFTVPGIQNTPSKLIINTLDNEHVLILESYGKIKLDRILDVLNENKHRFEINQSSI